MRYMSALSFLPMIRHRHRKKVELKSIAGIHSSHFFWYIKFWDDNIDSQLWKVSIKGIWNLHFQSYKKHHYQSLLPIYIVYIYIYINSVIIILEGFEQFMKDDTQYFVSYSFHYKSFISHHIKILSRILLMWIRFRIYPPILLNSFFYNAKLKNHQI